MSMMAVNVAACVSGAGAWLLAFAGTFALGAFVGFCVGTADGERRVARWYEARLRRQFREERDAVRVSREKFGKVGEEVRHA